AHHCIGINELRREGCYTQHSCHPLPVSRLNQLSPPTQYQSYYEQAQRILHKQEQHQLLASSCYPPNHNWVSRRPNSKLLHQLSVGHSLRPWPRIQFTISAQIRCRLNVSTRIRKFPMS